MQIAMSHRAPPDLHALIRTFGSYSRIPPAAWLEYDRALEEWKANLHAGVKDDDDEWDSKASD
jgi:hypothetical protein